MLKTAVKQEGKSLVCLGLSHLNLDLLPRNPIAFPKAEVGLGDGTFYISVSGESDLVALIAGSSDIHVEITPSMEEKLRSGELIALDFQKLGIEGDGEILLFAGATEHELVAAMRHVGLVTPETRITDRSLGKVLSRHRISIGGVIDVWSGATLAVLLGGAAVVLGLLGELEWLSVPFGLALLVAGCFMLRSARKKTSTGLEIGDEGIHLRHAGKSLSLPWDAIAFVDTVPMKKSAGLLRMNVVVGEIHIHSVYGEEMVLTHELSRWDDVVETLEKRLGVRLRPI